MANSTNNIIFLACTICFLSFLGLVYGEPKFSVEGTVYCDTCRVQFITKITTYIEGATVLLECMNRTTEAITYTSAEAATDEKGSYKIPIDGEHEEELCQVVPIKSPDPNCNEINKDPFVREAASVTLTDDNGIAGSVRTANPIGFLKKDILPECAEILREMGITPSGLVP